MHLLNEECADAILCNSRVLLEGCSKDAAIYMGEGAGGRFHSPGPCQGKQGSKSWDRCNV